MNKKIMDRNDEQFMRMAINLSEKSVAEGGGPFGAVIVKEGEVVAACSNSVTLMNDPTAHAEVSTIREACRKLGRFDLSDCVIYSSCEPCPMCLGAIYWAKIKRLYFANTKADAKEIGFDDSFIYQEIELPFAQRSLITSQIMREQAIEAFKVWEQKSDKIEY